MLSYPLIVSHVSSVKLNYFNMAYKQWTRLLHLGSEVSSLGILPKSEFIHIPYSMAFLSATLVFGLNDLLPYFYFTKPGLVVKSRCTHYFLQGVLTNFPNLDGFPTPVLLQHPSLLYMSTYPIVRPQSVFPSPIQTPSLRKTDSCYSPSI